jgi:hypothetical protein
VAVARSSLSLGPGSRPRLSAALTPPPAGRPCARRRTRFPHRFQVLGGSRRPGESTTRRSRRNEPSVRGALNFLLPPRGSGPLHPALGATEVPRGPTTPRRTPATASARSHRRRHCDRGSRSGSPRRPCRGLKAMGKDLAGLVATRPLSSIRTRHLFTMRLEVRLPRIGADAASARRSPVAAGPSGPRRSAAA